MEVLGQSTGVARGGVLHEDLLSAWHQALAVPRHEARARALDFSWAQATRLFLGHLVPARKDVLIDNASRTAEVVTKLSSNV